MATKLPAATANAMADALDARVNTGGAGSLVIYSGDEPATGDTALSGNTALATFTLSNPAFSAASSGTLTLAGTPLTVAASATGTASFFRIYENDGTTVVTQGTIGTTGQQLNLSSLSLVTDFDVTITSGLVSVPLSG